VRDPCLSLSASAAAARRSPSRRRSRKDGFFRVDGDTDA
jgi:hypothetical protein